MIKLRLLLLLVLALCCVSVSAQDPFFEEILLPVALDRPLEGAYGSVWKTELWIRNDGQNPVGVSINCSVPNCSPYLLAPGASLREPSIYYPLPTQPPGVFLLADRRYADDLQVSLRIRDLSRQELTWGTELPVVRRAGLRVGKIGFLDVPLEGRFRQTLRLYNMEPEPIPVTVRFYETPSAGLESPLAERSLTIPPFTGFFFPGYVQLLDFVSAIPELGGKESVYVEVRTDSSLPFWGFISVTNNETQHVTTITPR